jgi:ribosomal protein S18 acetylase RimI-like enzyme
VITRATAADVPVLVDLMAAFYTGSGHVLDRARAAQGFRQLLADARLGGAWIALDPSGPVGYIVLSVRHSMEVAGPEGVVDDLFVLPAARRRGLASALMGELLAECRRLGALAIRVETGRDNVAARALYRRFGLEDPGHVLLSGRLAPTTEDG